MAWGPRCHLCPRPRLIPSTVPRGFEVTTPICAPASGAMAPRALLHCLGTPYTSPIPTLIPALGLSRHPRPPQLRSSDSTIIPAKRASEPAPQNAVADVRWAQVFISRSRCARFLLSRKQAQDCRSGVALSRRNFLRRRLLGVRQPQGHPPRRWREPLPPLPMLGTRSRTVDILRLRECGPTLAHVLGAGRNSPPAVIAHLRISPRAPAVAGSADSARIRSRRSQSGWKRTESQPTLRARRKPRVRFLPP